MLQSLLTSFLTFFATIGPVEAAVLFATLTPKMERSTRRTIAVRATVIAGFILLAATLLGGPLLARLGVKLAALKTAGGIVLLMIAIDMIFARPSGAFMLTQPEDEEAQTKDDIAVFPLATPLLAGPGAMSGAILLAAGTHGNPAQLGLVLAALLGAMLVTLAFMVAAHELNRLIGVTAQRVLMRVFGILLASIAVQAVFTGIAMSGLVPVPIATP